MTNQHVPRVPAYARSADSAARDACPLSAPTEQMGSPDGVSLAADAAKSAVGKGYRHPTSRPEKGFDSLSRHHRPPDPVPESARLISRESLETQSPSGLASWSLRYRCADDAAQDGEPVQERSPIMRYCGGGGLADRAQQEAILTSGSFLGPSRQNELGGRQRSRPWPRPRGSPSAVRSGSLSRPGQAARSLRPARQARRIWTPPGQRSPQAP
jgi:hypothetical protein